MINQSDLLKELRKNLKAAKRAMLKVNTELDAAFESLEAMGIDPQGDLEIYDVDYDGTGDTIQELIDFAVMQGEGTIEHCIDVAKKILNNETKSGS